MATPSSAAALLSAHPLHDIQKKGTQIFNRLLTLIYAYPARRATEFKS